MPEHTFDKKRMARMDNPERRHLLPQETILPLLDIRKNDTILDVGAGAGYFTFPLATQTTNTVYALDMDKTMLDYMQKQIKHRGTKNITLFQNQIDNMPFKSDSVQRILASMVLHDVQPLHDSLAEIYRVLEPGGRFVVIDWIPEPHDQRTNRIHADAMQQTAEQVGFKCDSLTSPSEKVYALAFDKPVI